MKVWGLFQATDGHW